MSDLQSSLAIGALLSVALVTGGWLWRTGRPYGAPRLTVHKLTALAAAVLLAVSLDTARAQASLGGAFIVVTGVCYLAAGLSGGLLSTDRPQAPAVRLAHWIAPALAVLLTLVALYLAATPA